jgi:hypothetical protein
LRLLRSLGAREAYKRIVAFANKDVDSAFNRASYVLSQDHAQIIARTRGYWFQKLSTEFIRQEMIWPLEKCFAQFPGFDLVRSVRNGNSGRNNRVTVRRQENDVFTSPPATSRMSQQTRERLEATRRCTPCGGEGTVDRTDPISLNLCLSTTEG